jgi:hypothetical protein
MRGANANSHAEGIALELPSTSVRGPMREPRCELLDKPAWNEAEVVLRRRGAMGRLVAGPEKSITLTFSPSQSGCNVTR